jgi:hypothetical protein
MQGPPKEVVITKCVPSPNPLEVSKTGKPGKPNIFRFLTYDTDRDYEIAFPPGIVNGGKIECSAGHPSRPVVIRPDAPEGSFEYGIAATKGPECILPDRVDPPTIMVED